MGAGLIGLILGALVGALTGTEVGAIFGGILGMLIGMSVHAVGWMRSHLGSAATVERHLVMCTPYGQPAECELVGDLETGRWYDVASCSLLKNPTRVDCDKGCVRLFSLGGVRPGGACHCHPAS